MEISSKITIFVPERSDDRGRQMDFRKHSMLCYKIATKRQYGVTQKRNIQRVRVKVHYPLSPLPTLKINVLANKYPKKYPKWTFSGLFVFGVKQAKEPGACPASGSFVRCPLWRPCAFSALSLRQLLLRIWKSHLRL